MSEKGSVFQKGGGGTNFEQSVQAAFLVSLVIKGNAPCVPSNQIVEIAFQNTNKGYHTDDLLVLTNSSLGQHRLLFQIKHDISFTQGSTIFKEVISSFWKDYCNNTLFDRSKDKLIVVKNGLTKDERNHIKSIFNWANSHATANDFITEINRINAKKERLEMFRFILKEANNGSELNDEDIWQFLKCLDVLEYDFLNNGSGTETYFLNLIKLSKSNQSVRSERDIWNDLIVLASKLNKDGGNINADSIQNETIFKDFSLLKINPYYKAVEKLKKDGEEILRPLKDTVGGLHITRTELRQSILNSINTFQFTIVTGRPGVGKSVEIKNLLKEDFSHGSVFVFRADQYNQPHVANVLSTQGINESVIDIFSCISLISDKIIFIDSIEKLLEADPECAFKQLIGILKALPDIKIVASSRKYAIDLIIQKFGIDKSNLGIVEVFPFDDKDLEVVTARFPQIEAVIKNTKIRTLLKSPKYLDFAISLLSKIPADFSSVSIAEFKSSLWNVLVADVTNTKDGMPIKREKAFVEIAVRRAKEMKLFTQAGNADASAIQLLERDEIIFQQKQNRRYSPTHDILEDWALVHFVSEMYEDSNSPAELFKKLGTEPAIRRAFRLWVEDYLIDNSDKLNKFINQTINDATLEKYWADEILIAVFKSDHCDQFFKNLKNQLLANDSYLLSRCLHLIKTCCKESNLSSNSFSVLLPIGSGWTEALNFIATYIDKLGNLRLLVVSFLYEWDYLLVFRYSSASLEEMMAAKAIILKYIGEIEAGEKLWTEEVFKEKAKSLISILYNLAEVSKTEIKQLIRTAQQKKEKRSSWRSHDFYETVVDKCLSGISNQHLIRSLPEVITDTMWQEWKSKPIEKPRKGSIAEMIGYTSLRYEQCWGIEDKYRFFPSGIYKAPIYNLLFYHPLTGLKFITEFLNYSIDFYTRADCERKHSLKQIEVKLNDNSIVNHWTGSELWCAFRGLSVTHYAIECMLMSLEKCLLEIAIKSTEASRGNLKFIFDYLLRNGNNGAVSGVLVSIAMAYPNEVGEAMLPILGNKENYEWDLNRALKESSTLSPMDDHISFAQEERWKSNQLPHRKKYRRGLRDFVLDYQFNTKKLNTRIFEILDRFKAEVSDEDIIWKKAITEMDARNQRLGDYDKALGGFPIVPEYDEKVSRFIEEHKEGFEQDTRSMTFSSQLTKAYQGTEEIDFNLWATCFNQYSYDKKLNIFYDQPVTLAVIGLRDFRDKLGSDQKEWCIKTISNTVSSIVQQSHSYDLNANYNLMEKETALTSFHLLCSALDEKDRTQIVVMMIYVLFAPIAEHEVDKILKYIRTEFFKQYPKEGKQVWLGLIKYAEFRKSNRYFYDDQDLDRLNDARTKEWNFIKKIANSKRIKVDFSKIDFRTYRSDILTKVFTITPYHIGDHDYQQFTDRFLLLFFEDLSKNDNHSYDKGDDERQVSYHEINLCRNYMIEFSLRADSDWTQKAFNTILDSMIKWSKSNNWRKDELNDFLPNLLEFLIYELDTLLVNLTDINEKKLLIDNFWSLWEYLIFKSKNGDSSIPHKILLLDIKWKESAMDWLPFEGKKGVYYGMIQEFGSKRAKSILNVFSTIGEKTFLPSGLSVLVEIFKSDEEQSLSLASKTAESFIKRLFYNHITEIKNNKQLINDFVWILNKMVDLGSSEAYLFRENLITYKQAI
jgi:hypothetical protein